MTVEHKQMINLRARPTDVAKIDQLATEHGMSRTEYMIRSALGELNTGRSFEERLTAIETYLEGMTR